MNKIIQNYYIHNYTNEPSTLPLPGSNGTRFHQFLESVGFVDGVFRVVVKPPVFNVVNRRSGFVPPDKNKPWYTTAGSKKKGKNRGRF